MENNKITSDYNSEVTNTYTSLSDEMNIKSIAHLQRTVLPILPNCKNGIDFGCGAGDEIKFLEQHGIIMSGIDCSEEMILKARECTKADLRVEDFTSTTFESNSFDLVLSKWAFQANEYIDPIYTECSRLLKKNGYLVLLTKHPLRQFLEKKIPGKNYFQKETVHSHIFRKTITVHEPSHTVQEYLSEFFLANFSVLSFAEEYEFPGAEQINGDIYPTYMLIVAQKK